MARMWFGTIQKFQWVPAPLIVRRPVMFVESGTLASGGGFVSRSIGQHVEFDFEFPVRSAHGADGLDVFQAYRTGLYNDFANIVDGFNPNDQLYFADQMAARANMFAPQWASPMLPSLGGWRWIGEYASNAATATNSFGQPARTVTFNVTTAANTLSAEPERRFVIPIPPGFTLRWGWSGASTGTGVVRSEAHNASTGAIVASNAAALSPTASTRLNQSINGDTYDYVTIGIARTSAAASTVAIASMLAQLHPNAESPTLTGSHVPGVGHTGLQFASDAVPEEYILVNPARRLKGLSFTLKEIGQSL